jgi:protein-ribulosamine 3-kinase
MIPEELEKLLLKALKRATSENEKVEQLAQIGGGCINYTYQIKTSTKRFFMKWNDLSFPEMFKKEKDGLELLRKAKSIRIPAVWGVEESRAYQLILLEWINEGTRNPEFWEKLGGQLASLHKQTNKNFGLDYDNYIGSLKQSNRKHADWVSFFVEERLEKQLSVAFDAGKIDNSLTAKFSKLYHKLDNLIPKEAPALIHGDLWQGNLMCDRHANPVIVDPAVYYGHREAELSFTRLFGRFDKHFYNTYQQNFPLEPGFEERIPIFNLYPLLVHVNLFGSSYLSGIKSCLNKF